MYENFLTTEILIILNYIKYIKCSLNSSPNTNHLFLPWNNPQFLFGCISFPQWFTSFAKSLRECFNI